MAQDDVFQLGVGIRVDGELTANVMHLEQTSAGTPTIETSYDQIKTIWETTFEPLWQARSSDEAEIICLAVQKIDPTREPKAIFPKSVFGTVASEALPAINACLHSWYSFTTTPRGRGRKWWSGIPKSGHHRNRLITAQFLLEGAFADEFDNVQTSGEDYGFGIWSRLDDELYPLAIATPRVVVKNLINRKPVPCV